MKDRSHDDQMTQYLLENRAYAEALLADVLHDGDVMERAIMLRHLQGMISEGSAVLADMGWSVLDN